ncbi:MAG TPA: 50S ribosomal protein L11 methyltransferase [Clostridiales bacterium]|nr:50S ribosomal protein L11 methyltransferase [Clostridiales bacterium]
MEWTEITVTVPVEDIDRAGDIAQMVVPYGIYIEDYSNMEQEVEDIAHIDLIDEDLLKKDRSSGVVHIYINPEENPKEAIAFLSERYTAQGITHVISSNGCEEEDWLNNWKQYFHPIPIGEKLLIRPTWRDDYNAKGRVVLNLDPGLAFGTGTHETTRLCLQALEQRVTDTTKILDVGCGSGILAVAALLLGAKTAVGVDIDEMAVKTAQENAQLNNVNEKFTVLSGNLTDKVTGKYNIVVANIVADAIIMLSKDIKEFMYDDSVYIMSGIIDTRLDDVLNAIEDDFHVTEVLNDNGWYCLVATIKK